MAHPTIIIGIGSSGLKVLEEVQRFHYESFRQNKPPHTEYLYLETNKDNRVGITALDNEIKRVYISLSQMSTMIQNLKSRGDADWIPDLGSLINNSLGAGGIRPCGRLALWGKNQEGDNFSNVSHAIQQAYQRVVSDSDEQKPTVYIVGSTTGGTGSGVFIDIAYLVRELITDIKELFGLFLIPPRPKSIVNNEVMYANTYGVLKDLHYFNRSDTFYKEHWPSGNKIKDQRPPFELAQFISQEYSDGTPGIKSLDGLYKMAGLYLFLNIAGMRDKRMERLVDAAGNSHIGKYGTFGLSAIQFPKDQIQEYLAVNKSIELLKRWTDRQNYYQQNKPTPINANLIREKVKEKWDLVLSNAFGVLNSAGGKELINEIEDEAYRINRGEHKNDPVKYIRGLFHPENKDGYYQVVQNNLSVAFNSLIEGLNDWFEEVVNETENLEYAKVFLKEVLTVLKETIEYWNKGLKINSDTARWLRFASGKARDIYKDGILLARHKETGQQDLVLRDRMINLFELMKMHLMEEKLRQIGRNIMNEDKDLYTSVSSKKRVPRMLLLEEVIRKIKRTINESDDEDTNASEVNLTKRLQEIKADIDDKSIPILRIYRAENFEEEVSQADHEYNNKNGNAFPSKATVIGQKDLWGYLNNKEYNFERSLYNESIQSFRRRIVELDCVQDYDVEDYIDQFPAEGERMAKKAVQALVQIGNDKVLGKSPYLPRFLVGAAHSKLANIINRFQERNYSEFDNSPNGILELPNLKNIVVFYDEKGNYLPMEDIRYIDLLRTSYEEYPKHIQEMTAEKWAQDRNAYLTPNPGKKAN